MGLGFRRTHGLGSEFSLLSVVQLRLGISKPFATRSVLLSSISVFVYGRRGVSVFQLVDWSPC
jgi:hypothetical protein